MGFGGGGLRLGLGGFILLAVLSIIFKTEFFTLLSGGGAGAASPVLRRTARLMIPGAT